VTIQGDSVSFEGVTYRYRFVTDKKDQAKRHYSLRAVVRKFTGMDAWFFAEVPTRVAADIKKRFGHAAKGWGSLKVQASIGGTVWKTSIFPDKKSGTYVLPLKAAVRQAEKIRVGKRVSLTLEII
jgi:hypothetical protein